MNTPKTLLLAAIAGLTLTACDDSDDKYSYLRVYHASPDAPSVNVWVDGSPLLTNVAYQQSSGQLKLKEGMRDVRVEAILPDGSTVDVVPTTSIDFMYGMEYNLIATGKVSSDGSDGKGFGPQLSSRAKTSPSGARVQVMHSSPDAPTVDVFITAPNADLTMATPFADDAAYLAVTDAVEVPAGDYQIRITDPNDPTTVFFDSGTIAVPAGADWFAAATNNTAAGSSPVSLLVDTGEGSLVVQSINGEADLRVVHGISDAPGVDVWVDGVAPSNTSPLFNVGFKDQTDYLSLPAKSTDFAVAVNGTAPPTIVDDLALTADLMSNTTYTAIAIGNLGDATDNDELFVVVDDPRRVTTEAKLRAIHASTLAGPVDIYVSADATPSSDDVIIEDVEYKGDTGLLPVMPSDVYIMITPANDSNTIAVGPVMLSLTGGSITTLVAVNDPMAASGVGVLSLDD